jgi:phosphonate transport system ATP-binding protein
MSEPALPASAPPELRTDAVEVTYPNGTHALQRTSLRFGHGKFTVLLGSSGAGKSTLLRCLNGLVRPSAGHVLAPGVGDIAHAKALRLHRRQTGMVFQQHHLIGRLSVLNNVLTGRLGYHRAVQTLLPWTRADRALALAAIDRVGLIEQALKRADQLSGGQQQRVGVARALVQAPRILLADEPVASLDPATAERLLALIHAICKRDGLTAVISLHQLELARQFADRIVGLRGGAVVFDGPPAELSDEIATSLYGAQTPARREEPAPRPALHCQSEGVLT